MKRDLPALADGVFDVLVIGGGIFGAGIARDAALRGLRVALVDKADFASGTSSHRVLSPARALIKEPALDRRGLRGAVLFYDCQEDDARFCLDNIIHAADCGAVCANYCELTGFVIHEDRLVAAHVADRLGAE